MKPARAIPLSTLQVSRLESLIAEKICGMGRVSRVGYRDDGREVTILVIHDDGPSTIGATIDELTRRGIEIEDKIPDRMISPLAIQDGPDMPDGIPGGCKAVYARET